MRPFIAICYTTVLLNSQLYNVWSVADMAVAMPMSSAQPGQPYLAVLSTLRLGGHLAGAELEFSSAAWITTCSSPYLSHRSVPITPQEIFGYFHRRIQFRL